jgi:ABC transport system ATP-binding/permease protein
MDTHREASLIVNVGGGDVELAAGDVHYLWRDGERLTISDVAAEDDRPNRQLGYFVPMLGRWFFRAENVPAARVLRIDGNPIANIQLQLSPHRPTVVGLATEINTGPLWPRMPVEGQTAATTVHRVPAGANGDRPSRGARRYTIGRTGTHADIEIDDPLVRARHATVRIDSQARWWVSGEVFVDGVRQMSATLSDGDVFVIGQTSVTVNPDLLPGEARKTAPAAGIREVSPASRRRSTADTGLAVHLDGVTVHGRDSGLKRLDDVTLDIRPMEVVAVVGPSGAGKSSLIEVLMGELAEDAGTVRIGPATGSRTDPELRRKQVRYVPQGDDGLFPALTVRETLTYAARLRAAPDTSPAEIKDRVVQVLQRLGLEHIANNPLHAVSGGQKRRVSIGTELVGDPQLLLLDEPTSGLDPGKDRAIMQDLREIAASYRCTVVIVTHATEHLGYVDKVVTVGKGGRVCDSGPPDAVLATLHHPSWADLMVDLDRKPAPGPQRDAGPTGGSRTVAQPMKPGLTGLSTLLHRQLVLTRRRGRGSLIVLFCVPVLGTGLAAVASGDGLRPGTAMGPVLAILVTVAALTGASLTYPDIVNDEGKLRRDFRVGVEALPIVLSKALIYSGLCAVLAALVSVLFALFRELPPAAYGVAPMVMLYLVVLLTMLGSMGVGLLISAWSPSLERAVTWSTLLAVFQVALNGTLFQLDGVFGVLTAPLPARLGLAAMASYADFNRYRRPALYEDGLWNPGAGLFWLLVILLLVVFAAAVLGAVHLLHRRWTR